MKSLSTSLVSVALFVAATSAQLTLNTPYVLAISAHSAHPHPSPATPLRSVSLSRSPGLAELVRVSVSFTAISG